MTAVQTATVRPAWAGESTRTALRPCFEGANIRTWIGFKHFGYLAEEAVRCWFRQRGWGPQELFARHGLGLTVVESSMLLPAVLQVDDEVTAEATAEAVPGRFTVRLRLGDTVVLRGKLTVALVPAPDAPAREPAPQPLADLVDAGAGAGAGADSGAGPAPAPGAFQWDWRVPYYYCQLSDRLAHSGYLRAMEEVVDRFLADRGLPVARMLAERGWIPVVSRASLRQLAPVRMEETVRTTFVVEDVVKEMMYEGRMDCHVRRAGEWRHVATGRILHGYAVSRGPDAGQLARMDAPTLAALTGRAAQ